MSGKYWIMLIIAAFVWSNDGFLISQLPSFRKRCSRLTSVQLEQQRWAVSGPCREICLARCSAAVDTYYCDCPITSYSYFKIPDGMLCDHKIQTKPGIISCDLFK
eukprot:375510_1